MLALVECYLISLLILLILISVIFHRFPPLILASSPSSALSWIAYSSSQHLVLLSPSTLKISLMLFPLILHVVSFIYFLLSIFFLFLFHFASKFIPLTFFDAFSHHVFEVKYSHFSNIICVLLFQFTIFCPFPLLVYPDHFWPFPFIF